MTFQLSLLGADFKHYFSVSVAYLEKLRPKHFVCRLSELYREDLSQRFAAYLARIGLPNLPNESGVTDLVHCSLPRHRIDADHWGDDGPRNLFRNQRVREGKLLGRGTAGLSTRKTFSRAP